MIAKGSIIYQYSGDNLIRAEVIAVVTDDPFTAVVRIDGDSENQPANLREWWPTPYEAIRQELEQIGANIYIKEEAIAKFSDEIRDLKSKKYVLRRLMDEHPAPRQERLDATTPEIVTYLRRNCSVALFPTTPVSPEFIGQSCHVRCNGGIAVVTRNANGFLQHEAFYGVYP